ncbi:alginate lyase family protein [Massilia sp. W12]|uniref:heparinase II/III family protein n=1 Tax=Massilia sp. W12 TaxID=3126507 RepID=UPI0030CD8406
MTSLAWKINRLRTMGPGEITWRVMNAVHTRLEEQGWYLATEPPHPHPAYGRAWLPELPQSFDAAPYLAAADRILAGRFDVFALHDIELGFPPDWNRDPKTGIRAPLSFGKTIDYRDESLVGNIKYLWEPNRHYELVTLAQAWYLSHDAKYGQGCLDLLSSWFEQCPYPKGLGWSSSLENAVRLSNWAVAWHLLGADKSPLFAGEGALIKQRWLNSIYQHCHFIASHFSLHSSANNHLLGEYMGLFIGATTWPCWEDSAKWSKLAKEGLEVQALLQNADDGVNLEQGIWYHHEVADMLLLNGLFGRANGVEFSNAYWRRLEAMLEFVEAIMDVEGHVPMIGDSDDALMVRFSRQNNFDAFRSLLATGAVLFKRADFKAKSAGFEDKSRWLLGDGGAQEYEALGNPNPLEFPQKREFPKGGYYILGSDFDTPREVKIVADAGPLGYLSIAAHGHADALSFTLSVAGRPILIDPGTYAYHTERKWRDYFRGTSAHNTVRVDGVDQSESGGNFMWLKKATCEAESFDTNVNFDRLVAEHDGYMRLDDPVLHRRTIAWDKRRRMILVEDVLDSDEDHSAEFFWHFDDSCQVTVEGDHVLIQSGAVKLYMTQEDAGHVGLPELRNGSEDPELGWISRHFDEKQPCPTVYWQEKFRGCLKRTTMIRIEIEGEAGAQ